MHCLPVGNGAPALKYLAPYVFQVAISNKRIVSLANDQVSFVYTDARTRQRQTCTLEALAFIDRSLCVQHVLPKGFCKVRYYGCFSPSRRPQPCRACAAGSPRRACQTLRPPHRPWLAAPPPAALRCPKCRPGHDRGGDAAPHGTLPASPRPGSESQRVRANASTPPAPARRLGWVLPVRRAGGSQNRQAASPADPGAVLRVPKGARRAANFRLTCLACLARHIGPRPTAVAA